LIDVIRNAKSRHWREAGQWLYYTGIFGALPFWGVALIAWFFSQRVSPDLFTKDAELAVYSAGLLASAIPIMKRESNAHGFRRPRWFLDLALLLIVICALVFAAVTLVDQTGAPSNGSLNKWLINNHRILTISGLLALVSLVLCFLTELVEAVVSDTDLRQVHEREITSLGEEVQRRRTDSATERPT